MSGRLEPEPMPRRDFLGLSGLWAAALAILGSLLGMVRLTKPSVLPEAAKQFRIGRPDEFTPGTARVIPDRNVRVVANAGGIAALSLTCTHLGCIVEGTATGFSCPCHGSQFGLQGEVLSGPAPRGLRWLEATMAADGNLVVDAQREVYPGTFFEV